MKTPIFKTWQPALLVCGVVIVGVGLKVTGETVSATDERGDSTAANSVVSATTTNAANLSGTVPSGLSRPTTNNPVPADLNISPDLAEIIKLAQAGVGEDVLLAYITNSVRVFNLGANEIIYLNDLGVLSSVVAAMIQQDTLPESAAQKLVGNEANPLPRALALNSPAANIYPVQQNPAPQPDETNIVSVTEVQPATSYAASDYAPQPTSVSYFYDALAPYGNWVNVSGYGLCWQPTVVTANPEWRPYCDRGRWVYSDCGWYWQSDYSWGWAPFHYGRWFSDANYGWLWAPDSTWGPAWVSWRYSNDYCGWAPLPPQACFTSGVGFTYYNRSVGFGFEFGLGASCYNFVPTDRFCDYSPSRYVVSSGYGKSVYNQTKIVNKIKVKGNGNTININEGIDPSHVAAVSRSEIRKVAIRDAQPGAGKDVRHDRLEKEGNTLVVYRPQLPPPSSTRPAASGGRAKPENRARAAGITSPPTIGKVTARHTEISGISRGVPARLSHDNTTDIRPASQQTFTRPAASSETEKSRVSVTRSSSGLTIRGEPPRAQMASVTETASDSIRVEPNRSQKANEVSRLVGKQKQFQPRANTSQVQTPAPTQPVVRSAVEPARVERRQPIAIRYAPPESPVTAVRPQFNQPLRTPSQPVYTAPARPQYQPAPAAYSQPRRVERRNDSRSQPQLARSAAPRYAPSSAPQSAAPSARGNSQPSSQNSNSGGRPR